MLDPKRILTIVPNWLGDAAMATPALRALHRRFPNAEHYAAGPPSACALLEGLPFLHGFVPTTKSSHLNWLAAALNARALRCDLAVVLPHSMRAALLARISGASVRLGYARDRRDALLTHVVEPYRENGRIQPIYMAKEYLDLVAEIGCEDDDRGLELVASDRAIAAVREYLPEGGPLVGFAPGAAFGPSKRWPAERYAAVADRLHDEIDARCVLLTGPGEEDTRAAVQAAAKHKLLVCDEGRPTLESLKATISQLDLLVCNDSGPRHVAVAFGVPAICIMGPTSPAYSGGPYERGELVRIDVDCGPCQKPVCTTDHRCMTGVSVERVVEAASAYLPQSRV